MVLLIFTSHVCFKVCGGELSNEVLLILLNMNIEDNKFINLIERSFN